VDGSWERRVRRANQLAADNGAAAPLLSFYARLLRSQQALYDSLNVRRPSGDIERDMALLADGRSVLLGGVAEHGPGPLVVEARGLLQADDSAVEALLLAYWRAPSPRQFFPKAILQPYAQWLADAGVTPVGRTGPHPDNRCQFCGGRPQLSILEPVNAATSADGGGRRLLCAICLSTWTFRRVLCPHCGEEDERKLGYFQSSAFDYVRVDACDGCRHYIKTVDLTRLGLAVPLLDEVAAAPLDVWAGEHGYEKIELNLVGL
jgi:formate dehydrogenase maturation protein FdhE